MCPEALTGTNEKRESPFERLMVSVKYLKMTSTRQQKVSRLLQKELGPIFQQMAPEFEGNMITVTVVRISPDLSVAKVYLSIFPGKNKEEVLEKIREKTPAVRGLLGNIIRNQVRIIPALYFYLDDSLDYIDNIDRLLKS